MGGKRLNLVANILGLILIAVAILWLLSFIKRVVFIIIAAVIMAYLLKPPVDFLCANDINIKIRNREIKRRGFSRTFSIVIVYIVLLLIITFFLSFAVPKIQNEAVKFISNFPQIVSSLQSNLEKLNEWLKPRIPQELHDSIYQSVLKGLEELANSLVNVVKQGFTIIGAIFSTLATMLIVPLFAFLFLKDIDGYRTWFLGVFPLNWRNELVSILNKIDEGLGGFIRGQILVCICIGISTIIGLYIIGIDYAFLIGTMVGMTNIIPFAGPILGTVPALILGLAKSPVTALWVLIMFIIIHEFEKQLISPTLVGRSVGIPTLLVLVSILTGAELFGVVGVFIAVPTTIAIKVIVMHLHQKWAQTWPENQVKEEESLSEEKVLEEVIEG